MSLPIATYSFLPWLRRGLANQIDSTDFNYAVRVRAQVNVQLEARGQKLGGGSEAAAPVNRLVALFGPGDIVGIDRRSMFRMEPHDWITNFEPNYLPHIEFYDEDFPWRYTPAAPDAKGRLRPWITLLVLKETEFTDGKNIKDKPLPYIDVPDLAVFPPAEELWAWAHVHVNESLKQELVSTDMNAVIPEFEALLKTNRDIAYSRIVCPRKLAENEAYHAFVIPTFESGRRAGLKLDLGDIPATMSAWDPAGRPDGVSFPYYHRWFFRTGKSGDFETLVRLLLPKPVDPRVGLREMDVQSPDFLVRGVDNPELGGILKLGGALRRPTPPPKDPPEPPDIFENWDVPFPRPLQEDLAHWINLADDYEIKGDPDPIIATPLYGRWHALTKRVLEQPDGTAILPNNNWVHRLNLDPRFRVPAGFGTRVIQDQQEKFMDAAWEQIGKVLEAQRRIRLAQFGLQVSQIWYQRHVVPLAAVSIQSSLMLMAPLNKRILVDGLTLHHTMSESFVQPAMTSAALRRMIRPRGRLIKTLPFDAARKPSQLLARVNAGIVSAAPPKVTPAGIVTPDQLANKVLPVDAPPAILDLLRRIPQLPGLVLGLAILIGVILFLLLGPVAGGILAAAAVGAGVYAYKRLSRWNKALRAADSLQESSQTPAAIDKLPASGDFVISEHGSGFVPRRGGPDSIEAARFKQALRGTFEMFQTGAEAARIPQKRKLDLDLVATTAIVAIDPAKTIQKRVTSGISVPVRIFDDIRVRPAEVFVEPMAYPVIDLPMYEPLKNLSSELFLPNINLIEQNSITLLETNQRFIESYMVGLNHEFARELLWREYPTDQRGSTFRQFWDVSGFFDAENLDDEKLKEKLRDIPPLHIWPKASALGTHDNREHGGANEEEVVLVIRGEFLKRYPRAVIYAHRACWQRKKITDADASKHPCERSGGIDNKKERRLAPLTAAEELTPPRTKVLTPLYHANIEPDIFFFAFDLTVKDARGGSGANPGDDPGWFFVIKERPGEPRFGLDNEQQPTRQVWNDLGWPDLQPGPAGSYLRIASAPATLPLASVASGDEKEEQAVDDNQVIWGPDINSAHLAYILFQAPVLVAVHASEMLSK